MTTTVLAFQQQRRDTAANWTFNNPTLLAGELGYETDTGKWKIGDGSSAWTALSYTPWSLIPAFPITDASIASNAEIAVSKLADGTARQLLQTDAAGTGVEWASNIDIPGTLDVTGAATFDNNVIIQGDLTINGTETIINTQTLDVEDKNIVIGKVTTPSDVTADGGGVTLKGTTDKTISWIDATDAWTFSEHLNIASAKEYRIAGTKVLDATSLGSAVVSSSLTSVGTIGTGTWQGTAISKTYLDSTLVSTGDTGTVTSTMIADGTIVNADINASAAIDGTKVTAASTTVIGTVQLEDSTSSTSTTKAATPNSVKSAYDLADLAGTVAAAALPKAGGTMTGSITFQDAGEGVAFNGGSSIYAISDSTSTTSSTTAASSTSVKSAYDLAAAALPKAGGSLTGDVTLNAQSDLRFADADSSNWVAFQAPATVASNVTWTLPATDAAVAGYALVSNAAGTLSWAQAGGAVIVDGGNFANGSSIVTTSSKQHR